MSNGEMEETRRELETDRKRPVDWRSALLDGRSQSECALTTSCKVRETLTPERLVAVLSRYKRVQGQPCLLSPGVPPLPPINLPLV
jgi:hypothetical protein